MSPGVAHEVLGEYDLKLRIAEVFEARSAHVFDLRFGNEPESMFDRIVEFRFQPATEVDIFPPRGFKYRVEAAKRAPHTPSDQPRRRGRLLDRHR